MGLKDLKFGSFYASSLESGRSYRVSETSRPEEAAWKKWLKFFLSLVLLGKLWLAKSVVVR